MMGPIEEVEEKARQLAGTTKKVEGAKKDEGAKGAGGESKKAEAEKAAKAEAHAAAHAAPAAPPVEQGPIDPLYKQETFEEKHKKMHKMDLAENPHIKEREDLLNRWKALATEDFLLRLPFPQRVEYTLISQLVGALIDLDFERKDAIRSFTSKEEAQLLEQRLKIIKQKKADIIEQVHYALRNAKGLGGKGLKRDVDRFLDSKSKDGAQKDEDDEVVHEEATGDEAFTLETPIELAKRRPVSPEQLGINPETLCDEPTIEFNPLTTEEALAAFRSIEKNYIEKSTNKEQTKKDFDRISENLKNPKVLRMLDLPFALLKYRTHLQEVAAHNKKLHEDWRAQLLKTFQSRYQKLNPSATAQDISKADEEIAKQLDSFFSEAKRVFKDVITKRYDPSGLENPENVEFLGNVSTKPLTVNLSKAAEEEDAPLIEAGDKRVVVFFDKDPFPSDESRFTPSLKAEIASALPLPAFNEAALRSPSNILFNLGVSSEEQEALKGKLKKFIESPKSTPPRT
jgi:uncharacterized protein YukE